MTQSAEPLLRARGEEGVNLELSWPVFNNGSPSPSHVTERIIEVSRSLAGFELELNLPRCLLRREMVFLGTPPQAAIPEDSTCWWGGNTNSVDLDQVGGMV